MGCGHGRGLAMAARAGLARPLISFVYKKVPKMPFDIVDNRGKPAVVSVDGEEAEKLIPKIRFVIQNYKFRAYGDYGA
jgi:hypothetical protein